MMRTNISLTTHVLFALLVLTLVSFGVWYVGYAKKSLGPTNATVVSTPNEQNVIEPSPTQQKAEPVKILFGGDLMFDRNIRLRMQEHGVAHVLAPLRAFFQQYDAVVANLEGPVTDNPSRSVGSVPGSTNNFFFTFDPAIAPMLFDHNIKIVNLGNNHITNFGIDGVSQTRKYLADASVAVFGNTGVEKLPGERIHIQQFATHTIAFVNLNQFTADGFETALLDTQAATHSADIVVVMPHWGEEYTPEPNAVIRQQAHQLIEAGADAIIGAHPHVVQSWEDYQGKRIYYSLGNFVFDQYFSPEVQKGWLVGMSVWPDGFIEYEVFPIKLDRTGQTSIQYE